MNPLVKEILDGGVVGLERFLTEWSPAFPLLPTLADTPQEPEWHAEGDVYTHTRMVLDQLYALISSPALLQELGLTELSAGWRRVSLVLATVFHDIAKPLTTTEREIRGQVRIVAPRHAERGRDWLSHRLLRLDLPDEVTFQVLNLVGAHHDPKILVVRDKPRGEWIRLAHRVDPRLVYLLELADMRGRRCQDQDEQIELIELFRAGCEEYGVFNGSRREDLEQSWRTTFEEQVPEWSQRNKDVALYEGLQALYTGEIYHPEEAVARGWQWRGRGELLLLCGVSGSGKSSLAARHARDHSQDQIVISLDEIRKRLTGDAADQSANRKVVSIAKERVREALRDGHTALLDATNIRRELRQQWVQLGRDYKALVTIHVQLALPHTISERNASRQRSVPAKVLERQLARFQLPWPDEAHQVSVQCGDPE